MRTQEFNYDLPLDRIAQEPCAARDRSRMMMVDRTRGTIDCLSFSDLPSFLDKGDVLVVNDSRVIPARLVGRKSTGARVEILLLEQGVIPHRRTVLLRPAKRVTVGTKIFFADGVYCEVVERISEKKWTVDFHVEGDFDDFLRIHGSAPLPPYIKRSEADHRRTVDLERYQTVYAKASGSIAAPTAGLHFSEDILRRIRSRGVVIAPVTLHVGFGTFLPIETDHVEEHVMEEERYCISRETAETINRGGRVIAVGTTSVRTIETAALHTGSVRAGEGTTRLFIYPGFQFKATAGMLTNFHLPASSLFMLVCAFAGTDLMKRSYERAVDEGFRFYSYGDCMLIL